MRATFLSVICLLPLVGAFSLTLQCQSRAAPSTLFAAPTELVDVTVAMPPAGSGLQANLKIKSVLLAPSEFLEVRYKLPFGLDVVPQKGLAVCTKDGAGGEKVGDILRYTSQWTMGLPTGGGVMTTAASFSGAISWQCTMFNVMNAVDWGHVVEALTSNVELSFAGNTDL
jgi:hypothetical protein